MVDIDRQNSDCQIIHRSVGAKNILADFLARATTKNDDFSICDLFALHRAETELIVGQDGKRKAIVRLEPGLKEAAEAGDKEALAIYLEELLHSLAEPIDPANGISKLELHLERAIEELDTEIRAKKLAGLLVSNLESENLSQLQLAKASGDLGQMRSALERSMSLGLITKLDLENFSSHYSARTRSVGSPLKILSASSKTKHKQAKAKRRKVQNQKKQLQERLRRRAERAAQQRKDREYVREQRKARSHEAHSYRLLKTENLKNDTREIFQQIVDIVEAEKKKFPQYFPVVEKTLRLSTLDHNSNFELLNSENKPVGFEIVSGANEFTMLAQPYGRVMTNDTMLKMKVDGEELAIPIFVDRAYRFDASEKDLASLPNLIRSFNDGFVAALGYSNGGNGYGLLHSYERHAVVNLDNHELLCKAGNVYSPVTIFPRTLPFHEFLGILRYSVDPRNIDSIVLDSRSAKFVVYSKAMPKMALGTDYIKTVFSFDNGLITASPTNTGTHLQVILAKCNLEKNYSTLCKQGNGQLFTFKPGDRVTADSDSKGYRPVIVTNQGEYYNAEHANKIYRSLLELGLLNQQSPMSEPVK